MTDKVQFTTENYYQNHGIKDVWKLWSKKPDLEPCFGYFTVVQGKKKIRVRHLNTRLRGGMFNYTIQFFWGGWLTRLERIQAMVNKARASAEKFDKEIWKPLLEKHVDQKLYFWNKSTTDRSGDIQNVEISRCRHPYDDSDTISYSWGGTHNLAKKALPGYIQSANICQFPGWSETDHVRKMHDIHDQKWRRFHKVRGYLEMFIGMKLEVIEKNHKPEDIVEFKILNETYRFQRNRKYSEDGLWTRISPENVQTLDANTILPESFY